MFHTNFLQTNSSWNKNLVWFTFLHFSCLMQYWYPRKHSTMMCEDNLNLVITMHLTKYSYHINFYKPKSIMTGDWSSDIKIFAVLRSLWAKGSGLASWNALTPSQICRNIFNISDAFMYSLCTLRRSKSNANVPLWKLIKACYYILLQYRTNLDCSRRWVVSFTLQPLLVEELLICIFISKTQNESDNI